jgi:hypothetical protein
MKKLFVIAILIAGVVTPAHAAQPQAIAVIDSGVNTALFTNIVDEVCILEYNNCPNGQRKMDGPGAANTGNVGTNANLVHGTEMLSIIQKVNPSVNLIPIRIVGIVSPNVPYIYTNTAVKMALDWVIANRVKYNITVVNVSQGALFAGCQVPAGTEADLIALKAADVAVIAATGNNSNRTSMFSIACLPEAVSIGATDNPDPGSSGKPYDVNAQPTIANYSNGNSQTSFYLNARWYVTEPNGTTKFLVGTSNATAAMSAWWALNNQGTFASTYAWMISKSIPTSNSFLSGRYISLS